MLIRVNTVLFNAFDVVEMLRELSLGFASLNAKAIHMNCLRQYFSGLELLPLATFLMPFLSSKRTGRRNSQSLADSRIPYADNGFSQAGTWCPQIILPNS